MELFIDRTGPVSAAVGNPTSPLNCSDPKILEFIAAATAPNTRTINAKQIHKKKLASQRSRQSIAEHPRGGRQRDRADDGERP
jgi:hypothetical protein